MRLSLRTKLMAVVAINGLALLVLVAASSLISERVTERLVELREHYLPKVALRPRLESQLERIQRGMQDAVAANDPDLLAGTRELKDQFLRQLASAGGAVDAARSAELQRAIEDYYATALDVSRRLVGGETGESLVDAMQAMQDKQIRAVELVDEATTFDERELTEAFEAAARAQRTAGQIRLLISAICLVCVIALSLWIRRRVLDSLQHLTAGFVRFGKGDFSTSIPAESRDELGDVANQANQMARSLERLGAERNRIDWLKGGQAGLAAQLRGELEPQDVGDRAVTFLARYIDAPVGVLYYADSDGVLRLLSRFGLPATGRDAPPREFHPGDGLVGQAAQQTEITVIETPAGGALRIRSGTADGSPSAIVLLPLVHVGKVVGVLELGIVQPWSELSGDLLLSIRETLAIAIEVARGRDAMRALLAQTQRQAHALEEKNAELVDARRRLEQKAEELTAASRYKSQFLANMSHELRTPLNAILGFSELLHDGAVGADSPQHKEFLGDILTSGRHLLQLINDVLDLSKVEAGKLEFRPERVDLPQLVGEVLAILRQSSVTKRLDVQSHVDPGLDDVVVDPARLKQVLYNYTSNAIKFTPEGGRVTIRAVADGADSLRVEVEDTGIGIVADDLDRLFVEFQQVHRDGAKRAGGTGLGLALTKRLVEAQGGSVGVRSTPGQGSVFWACLPRRTAGVAPLPPAPRARARAGSASVLVIDDDPRDQRDLVDALARAGYSVHTAATGAEAIVRCRERSFDAITLDLLLPDMSGLEVLQTIRADGKNRDVPVIVITVVAERGAVAGFAVCDVLPKPVNQETLLPALLRAGVTPHKPGAVLVVDDDPGSLKLMATTLEQLGYSTRCERDGESALRAAQAAPPRAVVLDLLMPGMNGFEFLDRLRSDPTARRVPVIVWTVKDLTVEEHALLRASADAVVSKGHGGSAAVITELQAFLQPQTEEG